MFSIHRPQLPPVVSRRRMLAGGHWFGPMDVTEQERGGYGRHGSALWKPVATSLRRRCRIIDWHF